MEESAATGDTQPRDEGNAALKLLGGGLAPIAGLSKNIGSLTGDIRTIAESVTELPKLLKELTRINEQVASLDAEVKLMRQGVVEIRNEIDGLPETIAELDKTLHPLGRIGAKFRRGNGELDNAEAEAELDDDGTAAQPDQPA